MGALFARNAAFQFMKHLHLCSLFVCAVVLSACSTMRTVNKIVATHITPQHVLPQHVPRQHGGPASIVIDLGEQRARLYKGGDEIASSPISTGREGHRTPAGRFKIINKERKHISSVYGEYANADGEVVKRNVDRRKDQVPQGAHYVGAPMSFYMEFKPGFGLHAGYLPGHPASHGCVRMPYSKARQFYEETNIGTPVTIRH
jgi:lipoprotein-anchoring transpeptidase ErfK/SrfK